MNWRFPTWLRDRSFSVSGPRILLFLWHQFAALTLDVIWRLTVAAPLLWSGQRLLPWGTIPRFILVLFTPSHQLALLLLHRFFFNPGQPAPFPPLLAMNVKSARQRKGLKMHLISMITHLTLSQSQVKCTIVGRTTTVGSCSPYTSNS